MNFRDWFDRQTYSLLYFSNRWMISYNTVRRLYEGKRVKRMIANKVEKITRKEVMASDIPHQHPEG